MAATPGKRAGSQPARHSRYRFVIGGLILAAHTSIGLNFFNVTPLLPLVIDDYEVLRASASLLIALPTIVKALVGLPVSLIVNRFGLNRTFTLSWFMLGMLVLSPLAQDFNAMILLRLLYGLGSGLVMTASAALIMQWFTPREVPVMNTLLLIVVVSGTAISITLAVPMSQEMSWEAVLGVFGSVGMAGAIAWTLLGKTKPDAADARETFDLRELWRVFKNRTIFLLVVGAASFSSTMPPSPVGCQPICTSFAA